MTSIYPARSSDNSVAVAGWYPTPGVADRSTMSYWDGDAWTGEPFTAHRDKKRPKDLLGISALRFVIGGFIAHFLIVFFAYWLLPFLGFGFTAFLFAEFAIIFGLIQGAKGIAHGIRLKFRTPESVAALVLGILSIVGGSAFVLFALYAISTMHF